MVPYNWHPGRQPHRSWAALQPSRYVSSSSGWWWIIVGWRQTQDPRSAWSQTQGTKTQCALRQRKRGPQTTKCSSSWRSGTTRSWTCSKKRLFCHVLHPQAGGSLGHPNEGSLELAPTGERPNKSDPVLQAFQCVTKSLESRQNTAGPGAGDRGRFSSCASHLLSGNKPYYILVYASYSKWKYHQFYERSTWIFFTSDPISQLFYSPHWLKLVIPWRIARARPFWAGLWLLIRARQRWNPIGMAFLVRWRPPSCLGPSIHVLDFQLFIGKNWLLVLHVCVNLGVGYSVGSIFCRLMWISTDHCLWSNFGHVLECSRRCLGIK